MFGQKVPSGEFKSGVVFADLCKYEGEYIYIYIYAQINMHLQVKYTHIYTYKEDRYTIYKLYIFHMYNKCGCKYLQIILYILRACSYDIDTP